MNDKTKVFLSDATAIQFQVIAVFLSLIAPINKVIISGLRTVQYLPTSLTV